MENSGLFIMVIFQSTNLAEDALPRDFLMRLPPPTLMDQPVRNDHFSFDDVNHGSNSVLP